jgi:indole-3-glycerol phosphate synthase
MSDFFDKLALDAQSTIFSGYYYVFTPSPSQHLSLKKAIRECIRNPIIAEIKATSPSIGTLREISELEPEEIALAMQRGGAVGISVLTEPKHFHGSLLTLTKVRRTVNLPILMKDIILSGEQVDTALRVGADAILLIKALFDRGYSEIDLDSMITLAHSKGLEVLLETHTQKEFEAAVLSEADIIGINNRNLADLSINLEITKKILENNTMKGLVVVSESGIKTPEDLQFLSKAGASGFLIGSSIMLTENVEKKVRELVNA